MSVLVTGGAGFIGSHVIERLLAAAHDDIICLDNFNEQYDPSLKRANVSRFAEHPRVRIVEASFCDQEAMHELFATARIESVVHLGGVAGVRASLLDPLLYEQTNVRGTLVLLEAARRHPVRRFVLISSATVYGREAQSPFREDAPLGTPLCPYGATKQAAEALGQVYLRQHQVPVVCLRPFSVYGPRLRPDLAMMIFAEALAAERPIRLFGEGRLLRDFTHIDDFCSGLLAALSAENVVGQTINLGRGQPVEIREVVALLEAGLGCRAQIELLPATPAEMPTTWADISRARRLLGYEPRVSLAEGVADFVAWFQSERRLALER